MSAAARCPTWQRQAKLREYLTQMLVKQKLEQQQTAKQQPGATSKVSVIQRVAVRTFDGCAPAPALPPPKQVGFTQVETFVILSEKPSTQ